MYTQIQQSFRKLTQYQREKIKDAQFLDTKISYLRLNQLLLSLKIKGFGTLEGEIADKLENLIRDANSDQSLELRVLSIVTNLDSFKQNKFDRIKLIKSIIEGDFNGLENEKFWNIVLNFDNDLSKLFFAEKFGDVFEVFEKLGIGDEYLQSDTSCFSDINLIDNATLQSYFDRGLCRVFDFKFDSEGLQFNRYTKPVKVLNKNAFRLYLEKYIENNASSDSVGNISLFDIKRMRMTNLVVSKDEKIVYGDPYMAEFTAVAQIIINKYLPYFNLKGVLARIGGDEFCLHLTQANGKKIDKATKNFVSSLFYCIITKIEIIIANDTGIVGLSNAGFKNDEKPQFFEIDPPTAKLLVNLCSIPDSFFCNSSEAEKESQINILAEHQLELRSILSTKLDQGNTLAQIISKSATQMGLESESDTLSDEIVDIELLDGFSNVRFQSFRSLQSGHLCMLAIPFMKDENDKKGTWAGDKLKAKFEIEFCKLLAELPEKILNHIYIHKKTPKIIIRFEHNGLDSAELRLLQEFIKKISQIKINLSCDGEEFTQKAYPILFSETKSSQNNDLRARIDTLDQTSVVNWLKQIIVDGDFMDERVLAYLNSLKNGGLRTQNCLMALTSMSLRSTLLLRETIGFFERLCLLAGDVSVFSNHLQTISSRLENLDVSTTQLDSFYAVSKLTSKQCRLLIRVNALLQFNVSAESRDGLVEDPIKSFVDAVSDEKNYESIKEIYSILLKNYLHKFINSSQNESPSIIKAVYEHFIDELKLFTQKQSTIFGSKSSEITISQYNQEEFDALVDIFCDYFFMSLEYLKRVLDAIKDSETNLKFIEEAKEMPIQI